MIEISLSISAQEARMDLIHGSVTVVIDVLRATTVITTALYNGAEWVLPVSQVEDAWKFKKEFPDAILGGERDAMKITGFDNGNSPLEYSREKVQGRGIILTTTNGTQALGNTNRATQVLVSAFINLTATVEYLTKTDYPVHLLCSGTNGEFSMDDFLCAGGIISKLGNKASVITDDLGNLARQSWESQTGLIIDTLSSCKHLNTLKNNGFTRDLDYCLKLDTHQILGMMDMNKNIILPYS
jgi:2-phosphosulfolactate phosphatase